MSDAVEAICICIGVAFASPFIVVAWALLFTDPNEYYENYKRSGSLWGRIQGKLKHGSEGGRDPRVHAGLVFDTTTEKYETQYALSDEAVSAVLFSRKR